MLISYYESAVDIQTRVVSLWSKLIATDLSEHYKLSSIIYNVIYALHDITGFKSQWLDNVKSLICSLGFAGVWYSQSFSNINWFVKACNQKLKDTFIQDWLGKIGISSTSNIYRIFETKFEQSHYLSILSTYYCKRFLAFRTRNHRLPVETGRWKSVALQERICLFGCQDIGDEFHYVLVCKKFQEQRPKYLKRYYYQHPNIIKFEELMSTKQPTKLKHLCMFIDIIMKTVN